MSDTHRYNAVTYLLDRNVDVGRGNKLVFTDTVAELTYGALQTQTRRLAKARISPQAEAAASSPPPAAP